ncbi:MAG: DUF4231 domain-containing protein, partial [Acetobacteraceae bacterium]|nr:DUF4231 domain-containing protein [Acetobacteraceae bacterium]
DRIGWSRTADRLKKRYVGGRTVVLGLTVSGAALQTLAATVGVASIKTSAGILGAIALVLAPFVTRYFLSVEETRKWLRARSISEGIKSEVYCFCAKADPYVGADALDILRAKVREIRGWAKDLELDRAKTGNPSEPAPPMFDADKYLHARIYQQINQYYRPKARWNAILAERFRWTEVTMAGLAAAIGAVATYAGGDVSARLGPWAAVLTTVAGSVAAHAAANRYEFQAATFYATAAQLDDLAQEWLPSGKAMPGEEWSRFVRSCENVISAENRGWMAKLDEKSETASTRPSQP